LFPALVLHKEYKQLANKSRIYLIIPVIQTVKKTRTNLLSAFGKLVIDKASLLRLDVFAELHTLTQFENDSKPYLPIVLAGQSNLVDNLHYRNSQPLASRIVGKSHLEGVNRRGMEEYLNHHLKIAGVKRNFRTLDPAEVISAQICRNIKPFKLIAVF
jgi:type II secretory pathway predicted ATPase ExeA